MKIVPLEPEDRIEIQKVYLLYQIYFSGQQGGSDAGEDASFLGGIKWAIMVVSGEVEGYFVNFKTEVAAHVVNTIHRASEESWGNEQEMSYEKFVELYGENPYFS